MKKFGDIETAYEYYAKRAFKTLAAAQRAARRIMHRKIVDLKTLSDQTEKNPEPEYPSSSREGSQPPPISPKVTPTSPRPSGSGLVQKEKMKKGPSLPARRPVKPVPLQLQALADRRRSPTPAQGGLPQLFTMPDAEYITALNRAMRNVAVVSRIGQLIARVLLSLHLVSNLMIASSNPRRGLRFFR